MAKSSSLDPTDSFQALLNQLAEGAFRFQPGRSAAPFIFFNDRLREMLGFSRQGSTRVTVKDVCQEPARFDRLVKKAVSSGHVIHEKMRLVHRNGKEILCAVTLIPVKGPRGKVHYVDGLVEDLTVRLHTEEELKESKELFKMVFNNPAVAITVADKNKRIVAWNPFAETLLGMSKKDLFNKPLHELYPAEEWQRLQKLNLTRKGVVPDIDTILRRKDGSLLDVDLSLSLIRDAQGNPAGTIAIIKDITQQKAFERQIQASENTFRVILENSPIGITLTDENERIISWNPYIEQIFGLTTEELKGKPARELYPGIDWDKIRAEEGQEETRRYQWDTKIQGKEEGEIDVEIAVNVLKDVDYHIVGTLGIVQDVTRQKRYQRMLLESKIAAEEANNAKSLFLANMSHEVRTPMNTIIGMTDLTLDMDLTDEQRENLLVIKNAAENLLGLLNDILDLSRVEAGKIQLESIEVNMHATIKSVCKGLEVLAKNKGLEIKWDVDPAIPDALLGDPVRIRQVLVNLINNAIKFTFQGAIEVKAVLEKDKGDSCYLKCWVKDDGVGIPEDKLESIFDVFTQADTSTTRRFGGTGLGLSISRKLVEMMGGRIWVESEEFQGSTFFFTLELKKAPVAEEADHKQSEKEADVAGVSSEVDLEHLKILLAEDNLVNQKMTQKMLEKRGWTVKVADNGKQVLELLDEEPFDLILMDAQMPVLDGYETTQRIRLREKEKGGHLPIIALTARAMTGDRQKCLEAGMDDYIAKPIDRQKMFETIENLFQQRKVS